MKKKQIILPESRYAKAPTEELTVMANLDSQQNLLVNDEREVILDLNELFTKERNDCYNYKIFGKIRMVFRNMYGGLSPYDYLLSKLALEGDGANGDFKGYLPYNEFAFKRTDIIREVANDVVIGTKSGATIDSLSNFTGITTTITSTNGSLNHNPITEINAPYFNWNLYLSYVYGQDSNFKMMYTLSGDTVPLSFVSGDGIPFRIEENGSFYKLTSPVEHGMSMKEYIIIGSYPFFINSVGDDLYDSENYVINILKNQIPADMLSLFTSNAVITGKRCIDIKNMSGTTSQYYVHKHKTITDINGYDMDNASFESSIWKDEKKLVFKNSDDVANVLVERNIMETIIYDFKELFLLKNLSSNLGYSPTDIYVSVLFRNGDGYFEYPPKIGFKFNFHDTWIDDYFDEDNSVSDPSITGTDFIITGEEEFTFASGNTLPIGSILTGAFVEYRPMELKERIICESYHKMIADKFIFDHGQTVSTAEFSGVTITNPSGLFYQPHYRVKLRELSPDVEVSNKSYIDNLPQNAKYFPDEKLWKWRDLYDQGYKDDLGNGVDHPFMNNTQYVKSDINFYLRNEELFTNKQNGPYDFNRLNNKNPNSEINC